MVCYKEGGTIKMVVGTEKINVILLIKTSLFRSGVEQALADSEAIEISPASDISQIPCLGNGLSGGVAIIDIDMPLKFGFTLARQLKTRLPETGIIAFTGDYDDGQLLQVLKAQASACLRKDVSGAQLLETVYKVARGQHPIRESLMSRPLLADQVFREFQQLSRERDSRTTVTNLTAREIEILKWVDLGLKNKQIAVELAISEQTIKNHVTSIMRKLGVNTRLAAVQICKKQGILLS
jgi:two-component system, NarL family, response regulator DegU